MIDTHCHLDHEPLFNNISEVLSRAKAVGLKKLLTICTSNEGFKNVQNIFATVRAVATSYRPPRLRPRRRFVSVREILHTGGIK